MLTVKGFFQLHRKLFLSLHPTLEMTSSCAKAMQDSRLSFCMLLLRGQRAREPVVQQTQLALWSAIVVPEIQSDFYPCAHDTRADVN